MPFLARWNAGGIACNGQDMKVKTHGSREPERSLKRQGCEESIRDFWMQSEHNPTDDFITDPDDVWRCFQCGKGYKSETALKTHITRTHTQRKWRCTTVDRNTRIAKQKALQQEKAKVSCEGKQLKNAWTFKYLCIGSQQRADGDHMYDVRMRMGMAEQTAGKLRHVWAARDVPLKLKLRIYKTGVCSRLVYGSEAWCLTPDIRRALNGCNSRMLSHITGRTVHEEASATTRTYDIVAAIRSVRAKWLGHILRMTPERMVHRAVQHMFHNREDGDLLMDAPKARTWQELCDMARQRDKWQRQVQRVKEGGTMRWRDNIRYRLETSEISAPAASLIKTRSVTASTAYESARQYPQRDVREAFFRPRTKSQNTNERKRAKVKKKKYALAKTSLTDKERAAAAREHWELQYGVDTTDNIRLLQPTPATTI